MPGSTIGLSMGIGFEGKYSRTNDDVVVSKPVAADSADIPFGRAVVQKGDNTYSSAETEAITLANIAGVALAVEQQSNTYPPDNAAGKYEANKMADVIKRGVVSVLCQKGTPTAGGPVYVRAVEDTQFPDLALGGFEAADDAGVVDVSTIYSWETGIVDANGIAELRIKTINL